MRDLTGFALRVSRRLPVFYHLGFCDLVAAAEVAVAIARVLPRARCSLGSEASFDESKGRFAPSLASNVVFLRPKSSPTLSKRH
jgi:hypothetical protein